MNVVIQPKRRTELALHFYTRLSQCIIALSQFKEERLCKKDIVRLQQLVTTPASQLCYKQLLKVGGVVVCEATRTIE